MTDAPAGVDVVFERFPASVRGAVIVRGRDADPHQVAIEEIAAVEAAHPSRVRTPLDTEAVVVDVRPRGEVVIPFDVPFTSLEPAWYRIEVNAMVDGQRRVGNAPGGSTFVVPWSVEDVRRGQISIGRSVGGAEIDRVECRADRSIIRWRADEDADLRVLATHEPLPVLERSGSVEVGRVTVMYPVLKRFSSLTFEVDRRGDRASTTVHLT